MRTLRAVRNAAAIVLALASLAHANAFSEDLRARRTRMMERLGPDGMLILFSAPPRTYSLDVDYEYRQDSNLYYLTGLDQEQTTLVVMPGNSSLREILFVKDRNPAQEHWSGRILSREDAAARTGIPTVLSASQFEPFVAAMLGRRAFGAITETEAARFFKALDEGRARVALVLNPGGLSDAPSSTTAFANRLRERFLGFHTTDAGPMLRDLRLVKTPYERAILARATEISGEAQMEGMRAARSGAYEYEVKAAIEAVHRARGAVSWAYPSIVGSGPNATILHYPESGRQMQEGDLLLVDAACNYQYMSPDITRTYPVSGVFTPAQKDIYRVVLRAQEEGMRAAQPGASIAAIHNATVDVIRTGLLELGLITEGTGDQYRMWYTHSATHYIGIDVHDVGERTTPLEPGMTFVIEPGIYIRQSALDALPRTPENLALIAKIQPAVTKYEGIGVRIEDSFLLEDSGLRRLSASVPRTIEEIEAFMRGRPARTGGQR